MACLSGDDGLPGVLDGELYRAVEFESWKKNQAGVEAEWVDIIAADLANLVTDKAEPLRLGDHCGKVYGRTLGQARDKHVRKAWDQAADAGTVCPRNKSIKRLEDAWISRPTSG